MQIYMSTFGELVGICYYPGFIYTATSQGDFTLNRPVRQLLKSMKTAGFKKPGEL